MPTMGRAVTPVHRSMPPESPFTIFPRSRFTIFPKIVKRLRLQSDCDGPGVGLGLSPRLRPLTCPCHMCCFLALSLGPSYSSVLRFAVCDLTCLLCGFLAAVSRPLLTTSFSLCDL